VNHPADAFASVRAGLQYRAIISRDII